MSVMPQFKSLPWGRLLFWALVLAVLGWLLLAEPVERDQLFAWGELLTSHVGWLALLIALQALLFTLGLPGSLALWLVAPFMSLLPATLVLLLGSLLGALGGWWLASWLGEAARQRVAGHPAFNLLARGSDVFTQCALRLLPGFPHSVLNYGGGVLQLPLAPFMLAALVGLSLKWLVYVAAVQALVDAGETEAGPGWDVLWPLLALAVFLVGGRWLATRLRERRLARQG